MPRIHFIAKLDMILQGNIVDPKHIHMNTQASGFVPNSPISTSLAAWIGGPNKELSYTKVDHETNTAEVSLNINPGDPDTIKLMQTMDMITPFGIRPYSIACNYMPVKDLCDMLADSNDENFKGVSKCFPMVSNFDKNASILCMANKTTNISQIRGLKLSASILHETPAINDAVQKISHDLQAKISNFYLPKEIGATGFIPANTLSSLPMQGVQTSYAVLPELFNQMRQNAVNLPWIMYDMYMTLHTKNIQPLALQAMQDKDLILHLGCPMLQNRCNCGYTSAYSEDMTCNMMGQVCKETEEIAGSFSALALRAQYVDVNPAITRVASSSSSSRASLKEAISTLTDHRDHLVLSLSPDHDNALPVPLRKSGALMIDDCENHAAGLKLQHAALKKIYQDCSGNVSKLTSMMSKVAAEYSFLFKNVPPTLHTQMAPLLLRLAEMVHNEQWKAGMTVVTASNRAMSADPTQNLGTELAGHGVCMSQYIDSTGNITYYPMEGTTSMQTLPCAQTLGRKYGLSCKMTDGTYTSMNIAEYATILGQNMHAILSISPIHVIQANLAEPDEYKGDYRKSPFYIGAFYSGFNFDKNSIGCMPCSLPSKDNKFLGKDLSQNKELRQTTAFGAPVISLHSDTTVAIPITAEAAGMDKSTLQSLFARLTDEVWPPAASEAEIKTIQSHWHPIDAFNMDKMRSLDQVQHSVTTLISSSFDDAQHTKLGVQIYKQVADTFNKLQESDPVNDDGHRLRAYGGYMGAFLTAVIQLPKDGEKMPSGTIGNLKKTVEILGLKPLTECPNKKKIMNARLEMPSKHPFYMCEQGQGIVHAFNHKLA